MRRLRNCSLTTVAPTGTISVIAGCSSGIEPLFAVAFMRNQAGVLMPDVNEDFVAIAKREGWYSDDLMKQIAEAGNIHFDAVPEKWQRVFVTAHDVTPEWHIQMQAAFQDFTDSAISKTCNFSHDATEEYVEKIYRYAYKLGCKGVTVYRDGAREMQVLSTGSTAKKVQEQAAGQGKDALAEALGRIAELEAELARTRDQLHEAEAENLQRRAKRSRPDLLKGATRWRPLLLLSRRASPDPRGPPVSAPGPRRTSLAPAPTADRSSPSSRAAPSATCVASRSAAEVGAGAGAARLTARRGRSSHSARRSCL